MPLYRLAALVCFPILLSACGGGTSAPTTPGQRLVAAMELIRDGKPNEVNAFVVSDDQAGVAMFSGVYAAGWSDEGGLTEIEIVSEEVTGDTATVNAAFHFANGETENVTYEFAQEDGVWKFLLP